MTIRTLWRLIAAMVVLIGIAGATIITDYDHRATFSAYRTYSWGRVETANSMWDQRVKDAIGWHTPLLRRHVIGTPQLEA